MGNNYKMLPFNEKTIILENEKTHLKISSFMEHLNIHTITVH